MSKLLLSATIITSIIFNSSSFAMVDEERESLIPNSSVNIQMKEMKEIDEKPRYGNFIQHINEEKEKTFIKKVERILIPTTSFITGIATGFIINSLIIDNSEDKEPIHPAVYALSGLTIACSATTVALYIKKWMW